VASRSQFILRSLALLVLLAVVGVIIQETSSSGVQVAAQGRVGKLEQRIDEIGRENVALAERLEYARSLPALREIAKRNLGLADPGDRAIVILDDLYDRPPAPPPPLPPPPPRPSEPVELGYLSDWIATLFGPRPAVVVP
jgi:cell division protein FtsB